MSLPALISFGAVAPWPASERLEQLRNALHSHAPLKPIVQTLRSLRDLWQTLSGRDPSLKILAGEVSANLLAQWINGAEVHDLAEDNSNIIKLPLTVIAQLTDYISYLRQGHQVIPHDAVLRHVASRGGIQGFCNGLLSALTLATSRNEEDIGIFAAESVRLAFCLGAYVDLDRHCNTRALLLAVRWRSPTTLDDIKRLIATFEDVSYAQTGVEAVNSTAMSSNDLSFAKC